MNIVFRGKDGSVAIMTVVTGCDKEEAVKKFLTVHEGLYEEKYLENVKLPTDYSTRDKWTLKGDKIVIK
jgi:hypothetical protein